MIDDHLEETFTEVTITPDVKIEVQSPADGLLTAEEKPATGPVQVPAYMEPGVAQQTEDSVA